jgi:hypothetical protein
VRKIEIEAWALRVVDRLNRGQPMEDSHVELKKEWSDPVRAARQLAGQLNAAHGEDVLWLVGLDEKGRQVAGVDANGIHGWWSQVKAQFDELAPSMKDLIVLVGGASVTALLFESDRAPFTIRQSGDRLEVPWREGTATRSARRGDLVRMLLPTFQLPRFDVLAASLYLRPPASGRSEPDWVFRARMYITPLGGDIVFPRHLCSVDVEFVGDNRMALENCGFAYPGMTSSSATAILSSFETIISGPSMLDFAGSRILDPKPQRGPATATITMFAATQDAPIRLHIPLETVPAASGELLRWDLRIGGHL